MDDVGIWSKGSFDDYMTIIDKVLERLVRDKMKCNPLKCKWVVQKVSFLGHHITPNGINLMQNKTDVVLKMGRPTNNSEVQSFVGVFISCKSMWPCWSHVLAPSHKLIGTGKLI